MVIGIKNERGQMTIEMVLIGIILMSIALAFTNYAKKNGLALAFIERPWGYMRGMIEDGVWMTGGEKSKKNNPGLLRRHGAWEGDPAQ